MLERYKQRAFGSSLMVICIPMISVLVGLYRLFLEEKQPDMKLVKLVSKRL